MIGLRNDVVLSASVQILAQRGEPSARKLFPVVCTPKVVLHIWFSGFFKTIRIVLRFACWSIKRFLVSSDLVLEQRNINYSIKI